MRRAPGTVRRFDESFSLTEMLVVLTVISLLAAIVLPSMVGLFTAGADAQAYNALAGQLAAARSQAILQRTNAGVHAQLADPNGAYTKTLRDNCFTAVVVQDPSTGQFILAEGFTPQKMPGSMAFGRVDPNFVDPSTGEYLPTVTQDPSLFTTLTFVFTPSGQLVDGLVVFDLADPSAAKDPVFLDPNSRLHLWDPNVAKDPSCNTSVKATVMFDWDKFFAAPDRADYLRRYGQIIAVNRYTGALLGR